MPRSRELYPTLFLLLAVLTSVRPLSAAQAPPAPPQEELHIARAAGPIEVDGRLGDPGWNGALRVETFYETNPGDNIEPQVKTVAWLTYDDRFFYVAFDFADDPKKIRAPFGDHDQISSSTDYGGIFLDTRNDGKTGFLFLANPHNLQYDAISSDVSGEDSSPDFYWDSAARITSTGWTLEIRIPFSSLRYNSADVQTWGILLYRNWPRDFRYQMFDVKLPRGSSCLICHARKITGLTGLPGGNHAVLAPYVTGRRDSFPEGDPGSRLENRPVHWEAGLDAKWTPNANTAIDATLNPDFSQVEADVAQITANERFALFFPEKRPFFLEGLDLFATPLAAVYTRTITSPRWGVRATGEIGSSQYTALVAEDRGGGSVILPGPNSSSLAPQDFSSRVAIGRGRQDFGSSSFVSFLLTDREIEGGGHNRVLGPDFQWRPNGHDTVTGQFLLSDSQTPDRPDLATEWDGRSLRAHASYLNWSHTTSTWDWTLQYNDAGDEFRADLGFFPQVGDRDETATLARSFFIEHGAFRHIRPFLTLRNVDATDGGLLLRQVIPGVFLEGLWNGSFNFEHHTEKVRAGSHLFDTDYFVANLRVSPSQRLGDLALNLVLGDDVDFANERPARGITVSLQGTLRPTDHLNVQLNGSRRQLDVSPTGAGRRDARLFTADVARVRATYTFTSRAFLRLVAQRVHTTRNPGLYDPALGVLSREDDEVTGSALFAYKLNWQTVLFLGYSDDRALSAEDRLAPIGRALFFKISYAFQH
jgi:hypothetical protein